MMSKYDLIVENIRHQQCVTMADVRVLCEMGIPAVNICVKTVSVEDFLKELNKFVSMKKLLYFFTASWCGNCKAIKPIVEKEALDKGFVVRYCDMDTEEGVDMAEKFGVRSLPTLVVVDENGNEVKRAVGNTAWKEINEK